MGTNSLIENRNVRVFISSTFKDMKEEREYLMKHIFPMLKRKAEEHNVTLTPIDLRWGITEKEVSEGKTIDICFQEIENSIPFFIGIVGTHYGTCPNGADIAPYVKDRFSQIKEYVKDNLSLTEMEIQFGVLEREERINASFYLSSKIDATIKDFKKIRKLRNEITNNQRYPVYSFSTKEELGASITEEFNKMLDTIFPVFCKADINDNSIDQNRILNDFRVTYVPDEKRFKYIDDFIESNFNQLFVLGESGIGKSAFLAEWIGRNTTNYKIIYNFIGSDIFRCSKEHLIDFIGNEIKKILNIPIGENIDIFDLFEIVTKKNCFIVLILDAINQLVLNDFEDNMDWFPAPSDNIKFIFSSKHKEKRESRMLDKCPTIEYSYKKLSNKIRKDIITKYLARYGKKLEDSTKEKIAIDSKFKNTMILRTLLDELVIYGDHDTLKLQIFKYLNAKDDIAFLNLVFDRYESDYNKELVINTLTLLGLSKIGFNENEINELIDNDITMSWSEFYCAFRNHLRNTNGILSISHDIMKEAVGDRYIYCDNNRIESLRNLIINKFESEQTKRAWIELINQYSAANMWDELKKLATRIDVISCLLIEDSESITKAWINLCLESNVPMDLFVSIWEKLPKEIKKRTYNKAELLLAQIILEQDEQWPPKTIHNAYVHMQELCIEYAEKPVMKSHYAESVGRAYVDSGNSQKAIEFLKYAESLLNTQKDNDKLIAQLCDVKVWLSMAYLCAKEYDLALIYAKEAIGPCEMVFGKFNQNLQHIHFVIGRILFNRNQFQEAVSHLEKSFDIAEIRDSDEVSMSICNGIIQGYISMFTLATEDERFKDLLSDENYKKYLYYLEKNANLYNKNGLRKEAKQMFDAIVAMKE